MAYATLSFILSIVLLFIGSYRNLDLISFDKAERKFWCISTDFAKSRSDLSMSDQEATLYYGIFKDILIIIQN